MTDATIESLSGRSVLITGGAGFVGSHLAARLVDHCAVTVLDDCSSGTRESLPEGVEFVQGDVRDPVDVGSAMRGTDIVFHQAAQSDPRVSLRAPVEAHGRNATGTVTVLDAARREDATVVTASSAAVYGDPDSLPVRESDPKTPSTPYGIDKLAADQYTRAFSEQYGLQTVVLRYFDVYGPERGGVGCGGVVNCFLECAREGGVLTVNGDGSQTRDFVHVDDVVAANVLAATVGESGRAYNVGTGTGTAVRTVAERINRLTGNDSTIVHADPRPNEATHRRAATGRARSELGFDPSHQFDDGLDALVTEGDHGRVGSRPASN